MKFSLHTAVAAAAMATNQGFANLTFGDSLLPEYLITWLCPLRDRFIQLAGGATFKEISQSTLRKVEVPLHKLKRQQRVDELVAAAHGTMVIATVGSASVATLGASLTSRLLGNAA